MSTPANRFGFKATYTPANFDGDEQGWEVSLPHQCDDWSISAASCYEPPVSKSEAMARLIQFMAEADTLLAQIRETPDNPQAEIHIGADR